MVQVFLCATSTCIHSATLRYVWEEEQATDGEAMSDVPLLTKGLQVTQSRSFHFIYINVL
jgi:hypothetical protein